VVRLRLTLAALLVSGCFVDSLGLPTPSGGSAAGSGGAGGDPNVAGSGSGEGGVTSGGGDGGAPLGGAPAEQHCPPGEVATDISDGTLACAPVSDIAMKSIAQSCAVFYGWRDNCDAGCVDPPDRFGKVSTNACVEPANGDSSCQVHTLGADQGVELFGFDFDGDPNGNDRFYSAISCSPGAAGDVPCDGNGFVTAYVNDTATCSDISGAVLDYVRPSCGLVRGWSDQCSGSCTSITKQLASTSLACDPGIGGYCAEVTLGSDTVQLASFDTDGDPGDDDRLYFGLRCEAATSMESSAQSTCPAGQFVVGLEVDKSLVCSDLKEASMNAFRQRCSLFAGWRDACDACTDIPTKWGRVRDGDCVNSGGTDDSCSTTTLNSQEVNLYGLNLDPVVDGNDKLYMGFRCQ
jgi:hypothetical protein